MIADMGIEGVDLQIRRLTLPGGHPVVVVSEAAIVVVSLIDHRNFALFSYPFAPTALTIWVDND